MKDGMVVRREDEKRRLKKGWKRDLNEKWMNEVYK